MKTHDSHLFLHFGTVITLNKISPGDILIKFNFNNHDL